MAAPHALFICYRRDDSADVAGRIYDAFTSRFGASTIFKDVDNMRPGVVFDEYIKTILPQCQVFFALIGPRWLDAKDAAGGRRLDNPADLVRQEIETALATPGVDVIPVLINGAQTPDAKDLPESLRPLVRRNAAVIRRDPDFHGDITRLIETLAPRLDPKAAKAGAKAAAAKRSSGGGAGVAIGGVVVLAAAAVGVSGYLTDWTWGVRGTGEPASPAETVAAPTEAPPARTAAPPPSPAPTVTRPRLAGGVEVPLDIPDGGAVDFDTGVITARVDDETDFVLSNWAGPNPTISPANPGASVGVWATGRPSAALCAVDPGRPTMTWAVPFADEPGEYVCFTTTEGREGAVLRKRDRAGFDGFVVTVEFWDDLAASPPTTAASAPISAATGAPGDRPDMVAQPGGTVTLGSPASDPDATVYEWRSTVSVAPFAIARHETTIGQYEAFVAATNRPDPVAGPGGECTWQATGYRRSPDRPVTCVTLDDATAYAAWLSAATGEVYRLPTEAEWEYAARAGATTRYSWGDAMETARANCDAGCADAFANEPAPVGSFAANAFGLYDTDANVAEWTTDCWRESPGGPENCEIRAVRGGTFLGPPSEARSAYRRGVGAEGRSAAVGFRVVREVQ